MEIFRAFKDGLYIASNSFETLWKHKKLILYLGIPIVIKSILDLIIYNLNVDPTGLKIPLLQKEPILVLIHIAETYSWGRYILLQSINFIFLAILILENIVLTYHTNKISHDKTSGIRKSFIACYHKIPRAISWAIITFIPLLFHNPVKNNIGNIIGIIIFLAWSILTTFVIQAITIDNMGIIKSVIRSILTITSLFIQYMGALFWIGLIIILSVTPFVILDTYVYPIYNFQFIVILSYTVATILSCVVPTTYTIAKTLLYQRYKIKKVPRL